MSSPGTHMVEEVEKEHLIQHKLVAGGSSTFNREILAYFYRAWGARAREGSRALLLPFHLCLPALLPLLTHSPCTLLPHAGHFFPFKQMSQWMAYGNGASSFPWP